MLDRFGMAAFAGRMFGTLSSGEQQKVQLARTLMADPELLILDEPAAGLDLGAREDLVSRLGALADDDASPPIVLVTHHVDEIPRGFTHALLLRQGRAIASGPDRRSAHRVVALGVLRDLARASTGATTAGAPPLPRWPNPARSAGEAGEQAGPAVLDLVAEHPLEHRAPERTAVVKVHHETAALVDGRHRRFEDPRRVGLAVGLAALEDRTVVCPLRADHA